MLVVNEIIIGLLILLIISVPLARYVSNRRLKTEKISRKTIDGRAWYK